MSVAVQKMKAVYRRGAFRPLAASHDFKENDRVDIVVKRPTHVKRPLASFADMITPEEAHELSEMVEREFEVVNPDEWKN